ncbi:ribonuclease E inhibitor RraB [Pelagicoccus mobilis]|uniref:Ribonuclease E inhibitor RraB n=1 Tax=Pelagicoccus mobilis TaxID=415221 RepID=A0A934S7P7_9BACT|nr:ribonuclease E inhibitor RraB [Pelagicoccus mobilis]MBK1880413.1 ribonuclease E inhibitor RraB [Pelagicoccus mobilis]
MGLFSQIFGRGDQPERYRNEMQQQSNRLYHIEKVAEFLDELEEEGFDQSKEFQFQCIFTTDTEKKAKRFAEELRKINYQGDWQKPDEGDFEIIGNSLIKESRKPALLDWVALMCELSEAHDCEFASWLPVRP